MIVLILSVGAAAHAEDRFGSGGQIVPFGNAAVARTSSGGLSQTVVSLAPGALWFAADGFALGLQARLSYASGVAGSITVVNGVPVSSVNAPSVWAVGLAPEVATVLHLGDRLALFPQASFGFLSVSGGNASAHALDLTVFAPVVFIPVPHLFLGFGPFIDWVVSGDASGNNTFGLQSQIGGWF
ncbi:MAG TPA: hypothetical protein VGH20_06670 [Myxococcales bacterium]